MLFQIFLRSDVEIQPIATLPDRVASNPVVDTSVDRDFFGLGAYRKSAWSLQVQDALNVISGYGIPSIFQIVLEWLYLWDCLNQDAPRLLRCFQYSFGACSSD